MSHETINCNQLISDYFGAPSETEARDILAALEEKVIRPIIRRTFREKFHVTMNSTDGNGANQDALEVLGDVELSIVGRLVELRAEQRREEIANFEGYVRTGARNAFSQHLRRSNPVRCSLKNQLRYVLTRSQGLSLWHSDAGWMCAAGEAQEASSVSGSVDHELSEALIGQLKWDSHRPLVHVATAFLNAYGKPIPLEHFVSAVFEIRGLHEAREVQLDDLASESRPFGAEETSRIEQHDYLERLWSEIAQLPLRHRHALLLNLTGVSGESMIDDLPLLGVASIRAIAESLEIDPKELAALWPRLPLRDTEIAERLGLSRQQVINLRFSARSRLKRKMGSR
jgi:hypothetical protein